MNLVICAPLVVSLINLVLVLPFQDSNGLLDEFAGSLWVKYELYNNIDINDPVLSLFEDGYPETEQGLGSILECSAHWGELLALIKFYVEDGITYRSPKLDAAAS